MSLSTNAWKGNVKRRDNRLFRTLLCMHSTKKPAQPATSPNAVPKAITAANTNGSSVIPNNMITNNDSSERTKRIAAVKNDSFSREDEDTLDLFNQYSERFTAAFADVPELSTKSRSSRLLSWCHVGIDVCFGPQPKKLKSILNRIILVNISLDDLADENNNELLLHLAMLTCNNKIRTYYGLKPIKSILTKTQQTDDFNKVKAVICREATTQHFHQRVDRDTFIQYVEFIHSLIHTTDRAFQTLIKSVSSNSVSSDRDDTYTNELFKAFEPIIQKGKEDVSNVFIEAFKYNRSIDYSHAKLCMHNNMNIFVMQTYIFMYQFAEKNITISSIQAFLDADSFKDFKYIMEKDQQTARLANIYTTIHRELGSHGIVAQADFIRTCIDELNTHMDQDSRTEFQTACENAWPLTKIKSEYQSFIDSQSTSSNTISYTPPDMTGTPEILWALSCSRDNTSYHGWIQALISLITPDTLQPKKNTEEMDLKRMIVTSILCEICNAQKDVLITTFHTLQDENTAIIKQFNAPISNDSNLNALIDTYLENIIKRETDFLAFHKAFEGKI